MEAQNCDKPMFYKDNGRLTTKERRPYDKRTEVYIWRTGHEKTCFDRSNREKVGGVLADEISANIDKIKKLFPDGIVALVRESSNTMELEKKIRGIEIQRGNFADQEYLNQALEGVDALLHVAGIRLSRQLVDVAVENHVRRLILVHTTGIYSKYKEAGEEYREIDSYIYETCKKNGILLTILRPTMIYGNITDKNVCVFIKMVDRFPIMPVVNGARYELQPVHYKDLGKAYYQVLIHERETAGHDYNLSGGKPIELREMLRVIGENLGKKVRFFSVPFPVAYAGAVMLWMITMKKMDYREKVQRLCEPRVFSHEEALEAFGYAPVNFEVGVVAEVKEYRNFVRK